MNSVLRRYIIHSVHWNCSSKLESNELTLFSIEARLKSLLISCVVYQLVHQGIISKKTNKAVNIPRGEATEEPVPSTIALLMSLVASEFSSVWHHWLWYVALNVFKTTGYWGLLAIIVISAELSHPWYSYTKLPHCHTMWRLWICIWGDNS